MVKTAENHYADGRTLPSAPPRRIFPHTGRRLEPRACPAVLTGNVLPDLLQADAPLRALPLAVLYLTERCNSRCVTCDYWRHGRVDMNLAAVSRRLPGFQALGTRVILVSGGEPLLNPEWADIARLLKGRGLKLWLLTSGLSLAKHAHRVCELFDAVTVSLDGTTRATYAAIRGLDAFDKVCAGIRAVAGGGLRAGIRVTLQRANYRELPAFVDLARRLDAREVSFLAVDVANPHAFGRQERFVQDAALHARDLPVLEDLIGGLERERAADFGSGFIAESPRKLRRIHQYFTAVLGQAPYPPVRCNAPEFSAVIDAKGGVHPCFFIPGPPAMSNDIAGALDGDAMRALRGEIRAGRRAECATCVCSLWREPGAAEASLLPARGRAAGGRA
jgi:MoaA/NifB/PqqE/SkfB family radical SAM enzyme